MLNFIFNIVICMIIELYYLYVHMIFYISYFINEKIKKIINNK